MQVVDPVAIPDAARILGLSPARVRAMAVNGRLPGVKIGDRWLIERSAVERRLSQGASSGRPYAPHNAWALLLLASGEVVDGLDPSVRSRLRRAMELEGLQKLAPRLSRRAEVKRFSAHPGEVSYVLEDPVLVRSGISASGAHGFDLVSGGEVDGYLPESKLKQFAQSHALSPSGPEGNVCLRLVPAKAWHLLQGAPMAPIAAVAIDLAEDLDPRSNKAGRDALRDLDHDRGRRSHRRPEHAGA